jgi:hypothetical protein
MIRQQKSGSKLFPANQALVALLCIVIINVRFQQMLRFESFPANLAFEGQAHFWIRM